MFTRSMFSLGLLACLPATLALPLQLTGTIPVPYPETPVREVVHEYGTVRLPDSFAWLEEDETPEVEAWFRAQNQFARERIGEMPGRKEIFERIQEIDTAKTVQIYSFGRAAERYFYLKREVDEEVGSLYYRDGIESEGRLIIDPSEFIDDDGVHAIDGYSPSYDGSLVAVQIAPGGSEIPNVYIFDVETGEPRDVMIPRIRGGIVWLEDQSGFFYRQLREGYLDEDPVERYKRTPSKFHRLGDNPENDRILASYDDRPTPGLGPVDGVYVYNYPETNHTFAYVSHGVDRAFSLYYAEDVDLDSDAQIDWKEICTREDRIEDFALSKESIFLLSSKDAPRRMILKGDIEDFSKDQLEVILPESDKVLTGLSFLGERLYATGMQGGIDFIMTHDPREPESGFKEIELPLIGRVTMLRNDYRENDVFISLTSWERAPAYYRYDPDNGSVSLSSLRPLGPFDAPEGLVTKRVLVQSHDGVEVPLTIIHKDSLELDGTNPTILYGYGAYGISMRPSFGPTRLAWLERGGVFTVAHVRGGGEFGKEWHDGGLIETKRNSWLDLHACAEYLIDEGYTSASHLGAMGGSMGGVLVGRAVTSRPELYGAIVSSVGNHNPVRNHRRANGPANYPEYGNPLDPEEFPYVLAMDSYFAVRDGIQYPPVLLTSGYNDSRVDPWMPGKMAARLQQADPEGGPFFMRVEFEAGHGGVARSDVWEEQADVYTFLFWALSDRPE
ncbi:S9 family peptidase [Puniceicoccales bacterium CK1056]|uniref:prolyl oligopeptidase n=1 Tax=Oceanipulchritudo coccoides TaxID=2706888 RepID=A0A6B2LZ25_9BACT|nr:prolyl oligopeptidase family serine peptidase [Oceanipulchritudo coccoides]NDV61961.1 S9 family peptidase [Oceanipulchritudo coccoides]